MTGGSGLEDVAWAIVAAMAGVLPDWTCLGGGTQVPGVGLDQPSGCGGVGEKEELTFGCQYLFENERETGEFRLWLARELLSLSPIDSRLGAFQCLLAGTATAPLNLACCGFVGMFLRDTF